MAPITNAYMPATQDFGMNITEMRAFVLNVTEEATLHKQREECKKYGTCMRAFSTSHTETIFWGLFVLVVLLLCTASYSHAKSEESHKYDEYHPNDAADLKEKHQYLRFKAVIITTVCAIVAALCVALEGIAGTALNYCHQHKVINFYWAMWGVMQVGSLIAIVGVTIHQWASLREHKTPPWNIALGTPILVVSATFFMAIDWAQQKFENLKGIEETQVAKPLLPAGQQLGLDENGIPIVQYHGREWENIDRFIVITKDRHGGAIGLLPPCSVHLSRPQSGVTLRASDSDLRAISPGNALSDASTSANTNQDPKDNSNGVNGLDSNTSTQRPSQ